MSGFHLDSFHVESFHADDAHLDKADNANTQAATPEEIKALSHDIKILRKDIDKALKNRDETKLPELASRAAAIKERADLLLDPQKPLSLKDQKPIQQLARQVIKFRGAHKALSETYSTGESGIVTPLNRAFTHGKVSFLTTVKHAIYTPTENQPLVKQLKGAEETLDRSKNMMQDTLMSLFDKSASHETIVASLETNIQTCKDLQRDIGLASKGATIDAKARGTEMQARLQVVITQMEETKKVAESLTWVKETQKSLEGISGDSRAIHEGVDFLVAQVNISTLERYSDPIIHAALAPVRSLFEAKEQSLELTDTKKALLKDISNEITATGMNELLGLNPVDKDQQERFVGIVSKLLAQSIGLDDKEATEHLIHLLAQLNLHPDTKNDLMKLLEKSYPEVKHYFDIFEESVKDQMGEQTIQYLQDRLNDPTLSLPQRAHLQCQLASCGEGVTVTALTPNKEKLKTALLDSKYAKPLIPTSVATIMESEEDQQARRIKDILITLIANTHVPGQTGEAAKKELFQILKGLNNNKNISADALKLLKKDSDIAEALGLAYKNELSNLLDRVNRNDDNSPQARQELSKFIQELTSNRQLPSQILEGLKKDSDLAQPFYDLYKNQIDQLLEKINLNDGNSVQARQELSKLLQEITGSQVLPGQALELLKQDSSLAQPLYELYKGELSALLEKVDKNDESSPAARQDLTLLLVEIDKVLTLNPRAGGLLQQDESIAKPLFGLSLTIDSKDPLAKILKDSPLIAAQVVKNNYSILQTPVTPREIIEGSIPIPSTIKEITQYEDGKESKVTKEVAHPFKNVIGEINSTEKSHLQMMSLLKGSLEGVTNPSAFPKIRRAIELLEPLIAISKEIDATLDAVSKTDKVDEQVIRDLETAFSDHHLMQLIESSMEIVKELDNLKKEIADELKIAAKDDQEMMASIQGNFKRLQNVNGLSLSPTFDVLAIDQILAPSFQRITRYPLLLKDAAKKIPDGPQKQAIETLYQRVELATTTLNAMRKIL